MTDTMTIEEYHEYNRTGRMPERFAKPTRSGVLAKVAEQDPELARAAAAALNGNAADTETNAKAELEEYLVYGGFGRVEREYRFHPERKWRADYALIDQNPLVLVEYDGLMHHGDNVGHDTCSARNAHVRGYSTNLTNSTNQTNRTAPLVARASRNRCLIHRNGRYPYRNLTLRGLRNGLERRIRSCWSLRCAMSWASGPMTSRNAIAAARLPLPNVWPPKA